MTQPNQSELRELVDDSVLTHTGRSIGDIASGHVARELEAYITANYTPNSEVAERERVARINEGQLFREAMIEHSTPAIYWGDRLDELTKGGVQTEPPHKEVK